MRFPTVQLWTPDEKSAGWKALPTLYNDGGYLDGTMDRPGLQQLLDDIRAKRVDVVLVYKVDRLTRALADFAKIVEVSDDNQVSFLSVTQAFNTTSSIGRLTLNVLLSSAQFEREVIGERIRDDCRVVGQGGVDGPLSSDRLRRRAPGVGRRPCGGRDGSPGDAGYIAHRSALRGVRASHATLGAWAIANASRFARIVQNGLNGEQLITRANQC